MIGDVRVHLAWEEDVVRGPAYRIDGLAARVVAIDGVAPRMARTMEASDPVAGAVGLVVSIGPGWDDLNRELVARSAATDLLLWARGVETIELPSVASTEDGALVIDGQERSCAWSVGGEVRWTQVEDPRPGVVLVSVAMLEDQA